MVLAGYQSHHFHHHRLRIHLNHPVNSAVPPQGQVRSPPDDAEQDLRETSRRKLNAVIAYLHSVTCNVGEGDVQYDDQHWFVEFSAHSLVAKAKEEEINFSIE